MSSNEEKEVLRREEGSPSPEDYADLVRRLQEQLAEAESLRQQLAEAESLRLAQLAEAESLRLAQLAEERRLREEADRLRKESDSLSEGTYYSAIEKVWTTKPMDYDHPNLFDALRRRTCPRFSRSYANTYDCATEERFIAVENSIRSSSTSNTSTWPKDIFGGGTDGADIAHLIPHSHREASLYLDVVTWAFGFPDNTDWSTLQKAIHGAKEDISGNRMDLTGIKHSVPNKIRLAGRG
jgi:hypothetical protein